MRIITALSGIALLFAGSACKTIPVYLSDYHATMGGSNNSVSISRGELTTDGSGINGFQQGATPTAVLFTDESGKKHTIYSEKNQLLIYHKEDWNIKDGTRRLVINRYFYQPESAALRIMRYILAIPTLGYSLLFSGEFYSSHLVLYHPTAKVGLLETELMAAQQATGNFLAGRMFNNIILEIKSVGNSALTSEFFVTDSLPDFLQVKDVTYYSNADIKDVTYQIHNRGDQQVVALKISPGSGGLKPNKVLQVKIGFKVEQNKLLSEKYATREILRIGN